MKIMYSKTFRITLSLAASAIFLLASQTPVSAIGDGCSTGFASGNGTSGDPYMITTVQEFKEIEDCSASYTYFEIANDIDFGGNEPGTGISTLNGQLDGSGFTLKDVFVDTAKTISMNSEVFALFVDSSDGSIMKDITFDKPIIGSAVDTSLEDTVVKDAIVGSASAQADRTGIIFGYFQGFDDGTQFRNISVQGGLHCGEKCGGVSGYLSFSSSATSTLIENINSDVEIKSTSSTDHAGGVFGQLALNRTTTVTDLSVKLSGTDQSTNVGGFAGNLYVPNVYDSEISITRAAVTGVIPPGTNQGGLVGELTIYKNLDFDYGEIVVGASFGGPSTNSRLLVGNKTEYSGKVLSNNLTNAEVFHTTSFSSGSEYVPQPNSGGTFTQIAAADRSTPASYSSFDITDNLSTSASWYVQAADTKSELFGGYPVPYALANSAAFGPRYFFKPNGGTGTAVGRVGPLPTALIDPIANPFTRTGFEFDSWNNSATGPGQTLGQSGGITGLDGGSIYARWNELYDTIFDANTADSGSVASIIDDNSITVPGKGNLTKNGFEFAGWNTSANGNGTPYSEGDTLNLTADTTLYAQWQQPQSTPAPYSGPLITSVGSGSAINASSTETIRVSGERLGSVSGVLVDGKEGTVVSVEADHFMMTLPEDLSPGTYDLVVQSSIGNLTYLDAITILGSSAARDSETIESTSYGSVTAWTKRISDTQAKVYVKFPTVGEKVRIGHQRGGSGSYESVYVKTTSSETMEGLRTVEGVGTYVVRTIDLGEINRIRVTVGDEELVQVRYNN
jgi:uncharacterized repeat protein (TIGR02543 family)